MPKNSLPDGAATDKRAAARLFWISVLACVLSIAATFWLFRAIGMLDSMPPESDVFMIVVCVVAMLAFLFTHRNADGTIRWSRPVTRRTSASKPPQGHRTVLLLAATGVLYWLLVNVLHLSGGMLSLAKIVSGTIIAVLCARYVLRSQTRDVSID